MGWHIILQTHFGCWPLQDPFLKQTRLYDPSSVNPLPQRKSTQWGWVVSEPNIQPLWGVGSKPQSCPEEKRKITNEYTLYYKEVAGFHKDTMKLVLILRKNCFISSINASIYIWTQPLNGMAPFKHLLPLMILHRVNNTLTSYLN